jgi:hypothetical protein
MVDPRRVKDASPLTLKEPEMKIQVLRAVSSLFAFACCLPVASAQTVNVKLISYEEVPAVSSPAGGRFQAHIDERAGTIDYQLSYDGLEGDVRQAHIHFGQQGVNGGIVVYLCQTTFNPDPTGLAPVCVQSGSVAGILRAENMTDGAVGQGIAAGEFAELIDAIRSGVAYVNVHSSKFLGGETRGQLHGHGR